MDSPEFAGEVPLAMVGIVPCKATAENGAIRRGDLLVTSRGWQGVTASGLRQRRHRMHGQ